MVFYLNYLPLFSYESHDTLTHENQEFIRILSRNRDPISIMKQPCVTQQITPCPKSRQLLSITTPCDSRYVGLRSFIALCDTTNHEVQLSHTIIKQMQMVNDEPLCDTTKHTMSPSHPVTSPCLGRVH